MADYIQIFTSGYEGMAPGSFAEHGGDYHGWSGPGSQVNYNINSYVPFLRKFIVDNNIVSVADLGCGDFLCGKLIYGDLTQVKYHGYDAYARVIEHHKKSNYDDRFAFEHLDFLRDREELVPADLYILKDVIQHWKLEDIYTFLDYLVASKKYKYILITNCSQQHKDNNDIPAGHWMGLSAKNFPLKKYNAEILLTYHTKEVSVIRC